MSTGRGPSLIGASAGSGKTSRLTKVVTDAVDPRRPEPVALQALVAVTYTRKGAAELASRIRQSFARAGAHSTTHQLPLAYIGTVHAVCLRLVKEFAIDAGLSPLVDVVPGGEDRLLRQALEWGLDPKLRSRLDALADEFELRADSKKRRVDWLTPVQDIMTLARSNRIAAVALPTMAQRSATRLLELLGPAEKDGKALDADLLTAMRAAASDLVKTGDNQKNTTDVRNSLDDLLKKAERGTLDWSDWVRLQRLKPGTSSLPAMTPLREVASRVDSHPRFQEGIRDLTLAIYEAAQRGLSFYDEWKNRRRIIDFVDMLDRALTLVEHPDIRQELLQRFELLVVDEFQDTSPVQLALFVRLHELAGRSTWVGDRKQCIFEYAGADPELMEAVARWARASGGKVDHLPHNWRSRPELVECCNTLFAAALARYGFSDDEVRTSPKRSTPDTLLTLPPLGLWSLSSNNAEQDAEALAEGVRRTLTTANETPVHDRTTDTVRSVRPGDIAVLVATNADAQNLAVALAKRGVKAAIARAGLLSTPEGVLTVAALRRLVEPNNELASAEIEALTGLGGLEPDTWLNDRVVREAERQTAPGTNNERSQRAPNEYVARLTSLALEVHGLGPTEAVDRVLSCLDLAALCRRWPNPKQRLGNLDALRGLAAEYEQHCEHNREAATVAGLLRFFDEASEKVLVRDEVIASDDQHTASGPEAVTIVTYHRAKGLEWPVVVLAGLGRWTRRDAFEVSPETDGKGFDPADPLGGRWIRYWPWPFGDMGACRLLDVAAGSTEGMAVAAREEQERARLLYVGFTRARDHLVLAARATSKGHKLDWLDELRGDDGAPLLNLPAPSEPATERIYVRIGHPSKLAVPTRWWTLAPDAEPPVVDDQVQHGWFAPVGPPRVARAPYRINPSQALVGLNLVLPVPVEEVSLGSRLAPSDGRRDDWDVVGNAVHAFLAADIPDLSKEQRLERAARLLGTAGLVGIVTPQSLLDAGDRLRSWIESRWPDAKWHREIPISATVASPEGVRRIVGVIDLLLEIADGVVLIDHKSFPGGRSALSPKAAEFASQFAAYEEALKHTGRVVVEQWVHFPVAGAAVRLGRASDLKDASRFDG